MLSQPGRCIGHRSFDRSPQAHLAQPLRWLCIALSFSAASKQSQCHKMAVVDSNV